MPEERQPCIYIMASDRLGTLYIGVTSNLMRRLAQHRSGALEGFTARHQGSSGWSFTNSAAIWRGPSRARSN